MSGKEILHCQTRFCPSALCGRYYKTRSRLLSERPTKRGPHQLLCNPPFPSQSLSRTCRSQSVSPIHALPSDVFLTNSHMDEPNTSLFFRSYLFTFTCSSVVTRPRDRLPHHAVLQIVVRNPMKRLTFAKCSFFDVCHEVHESLI